MLFKLAILLSAICTISPETVEIECSDFGVYCLVDELPEELPANATWKFLCPGNCFRIRTNNVTFPRFPRELWNTHQLVTHLEMYGTDFEELAFGDFFNAAKLTSITLSSNKKFMSLRDNCFWGAFELVTLDLNGNKISELESGAFNGLPLLTLLELENNNISHISNDHFRNLPNLRYLYLTFNTIETIESEAFLHNTNMDYVNIDSNHLNEVDLLLPFTNTEAISLCGNQLTKIFLRSISQEIEEFDNGVFFYLNNNELTQLYIQPNFAADWLFLYANPIERIDTLPVLRSLKLLTLQWCKIKSLDGQRFADKYVNLEVLQLTGNNMISFSNETFAGLDKLETLVLDDNELTEVDFPRLKSLNFLDMKNNNLTKFPYDEDIRDTFPSLIYLDIRNNNFDGEYLAELVKILEDQGIFVNLEPLPSGKLLNNQLNNELNNQSI